jgi:hypothetical protein
LTTRLPLFLLNFGVWSGAKVRTSCRFLLKTEAANEPAVAKVCFDTTEKDPSQVILLDVECC